MLYDSVPGLLEKRKANKLAKETAVFASSDVEVHSENVQSNLINNENVASNQLKNGNFQSKGMQDYNVDELCNDFKEIYQASTFSFMQVC